MKRRRYDTVGLAEDLKREKRNAVLLAFGGVGILLIIMGIYVAAVGDDDTPVATEQTQAPSAENAGRTDQTASDNQAKADEVVEEKNEPTQAPGIVNVELPRKLPFWVDGESHGKIKSKTLELAPGPHELKFKLGKKQVVETLDVEAGKTYDFSGPTTKQKSAKTKKAKKSK